jgi:hypothetical protein
MHRAPFHHLEAALVEEVDDDWDGESSSAAEKSEV